MTDPRRAFVETVLPFAALAVCLAALLIVNVGDLDHGFHVAQGNWILAHGLPGRQILVPALADRPWTSVYPLGSVALALAWKAAGPTGLVFLKLLGYGGAFLLSAAAAVRRGAPAWLACLLAGLVACTLSIRFVERPELFTQLLLGLVAWFFAAPGVGDRIERAPASHVLAFAAVSTLWCATHGGWNIGLFAAAMLTLATVRRWSARLALGAAAVLVPVAVVALVHPAGWRALAGPLAFVGGEGAKFGVAEHQLTAWRPMLLAVAVPVGALATIAVLARRRRWAETALLAGLVAGNAAYPRFVLPLAVVGLPLACELLAGLPRVPRALPARSAVLAALLVALAGPCTIAAVAWRTSGFGMDSVLDTRGVASALDPCDGTEGPVLAAFGWSSLLLSNPQVARQGVVMDGRLEEYDRAYFEDLYKPALFGADRADWPEVVARTGAAFYCEPWGDRRSIPALAARFRDRLGWRLVTWDNSSRLYARPDVVDRLRLPVMERDPALEEWLTPDTPPEAIDAYAAEIRRQVDFLEDRGLPSARGRVIVARLAFAAGDDEAARESLGLAAEGGAMRLASWWRVRGGLALRGGELSTARLCARRLRRLGDDKAAAYIEDSISTLEK